MAGEREGGMQRETIASHHFMSCILSRLSTYSRYVLVPTHSKALNFLAQKTREIGKNRKRSWHRTPTHRTDFQTPDPIIDLDLQTPFSPPPPLVPTLIVRKIPLMDPLRVLHNRRKPPHDPLRLGRAGRS